MNTIVTTLRSPHRILDVSTPKIMGILNVTPDSFFNESRVDKTNKGVDMVGEMLEDGATIIDIGGCSTRPGSKNIDPQEEIDRVVPVLAAVRKAYPNVFISIDTYQSKVVEECVNYQIDMTNDVSGGSFDDQLFSTVAKHKLIYVVMHMLGTPETMQENPTYHDVLTEMLTYVSDMINECKSYGIYEIVVDPGIGFGKTIRHNYQIINQLSTFQIFNQPILIGLSRKSFIYKTLKTGPEQALNGTTAMHMIALTNGAKLLRVHDVKEAKECVDLFNRLRISTSTF